MSKNKLYFPCVVCGSPVRTDLPTIRWYYANAMKDPKYNKREGLCCSKCFNRDYDKIQRTRTRKKPRVPDDPDQSKLS
jgi:hypothetical protein